MRGTHARGHRRSPSRHACRRIAGPGAHGDRGLASPRCLTWRTGGSIGTHQKFLDAACRIRWFPFDALTIATSAQPEELPMRTLISTAFVSADGVMEAPGGEEGHRSSGWTFKDIEFDPAAYELK